MPRLCIMPVAILRDSRVSGLDLRAAMALSNFAGPDGGGIWASMATLARVAGMNDRVFRRALARLESFGWVSRQIRRPKTSLLAINMEYLPPDEFDRYSKSDRSTVGIALSDSVTEATGPNWSGSDRSDSTGPSRSGSDRTGSNRSGSTGPHTSGLPDRIGPVNRTNMAPQTTSLAAPLSPPLIDVPLLTERAADAVASAAPASSSPVGHRFITGSPLMPDQPTLAVFDVGDDTTEQSPAAPADTAAERAPAAERPARAPRTGKPKAPTAKWPHFAHDEREWICRRLVEAKKRDLTPGEIGHVVKAFGERWYAKPEHERHPDRPTNAEIREAVDEILDAASHAENGSYLRKPVSLADSIGLVVEALRQYRWDPEKRMNAIDRILGLRYRRVAS
jgi:hypothetical protein